MSNIGRSVVLSDVLDLSRKSMPETILDISSDVKNILKNYMKDISLISDKMELEKILMTINNELQVEESISTILLAMKFSQSKTLLNPVKSGLTNRSSQSESVHDYKTKQKPEIANEGSKSDDFHLTSEMSRKLLDHQFVTRQKMINSQLEKVLYDMPLKRPQLQHTDEFIPNTTNQEFIALVGFSEVVDVLKQEQHKQNSDAIDTEISIEVVNVCIKCGTDASPIWKKHKIFHDTEETICLVCNNEILHSQSRKDLEEQINKLKLQFDEQEMNLIRDYNDMLSSPKKLEMFRQEQEKRHRIQRMGNFSSNKPTRQSINSSQNIKSSNSKPNIPIFNKPNICSSSSVPIPLSKIPQRSQKVKDFVTTKPVSVNMPSNTSTNADPAQAQLTYLQFLQAFTLQAANSQQNIDQENLQKLEQILAMVQSNPMLANNNMTVLQLIANLSNYQDKNNNDSTNPTTNSSNNNLMNLLSYFVNFLQTQQNQNVV